MKMDELGKKLYDVLGGRENILQAYNCMTRLRVQLKEKDEKLHCWRQSSRCRGLWESTTPRKNCKSS